MHQHPGSFSNSAGYRSAQRSLHSVGLDALLQSEPDPPIDRLAFGASPAPGLYRLESAAGASAYRVLDLGAIPPYDVIHTPRLLDRGNSGLADRLRSFNHIFAVVDPEVFRIYGSKLSEYLSAFRIDYEIIPLPAQINSEDNKSVDVWTNLVCYVSRRGIDDGAAFVAVGGGVTIDLVGFLSSTLRRGVPYLAVPTTLTAMIDAAISPKTAINVGTNKNAVGTVFPANAVLWDTGFLRSDPSKRTGVAELLKLAIIRSAPLFDHLEIHRRSLFEDRVQSRDAIAVIDFAIRLFLGMKFEVPYYGNKPASMRAFGHSFSRRLESDSQFLLTHGEAVGLEMGVATRLAQQRGLLQPGDADRIILLLDEVGLLPDCPCCNAEQIWPSFENRSRAGRPFFFPVPNGKIGSGVFLESFEKRELTDAIAALPTRSANPPDSGRSELLRSQN
jgi:2-epi-5-epi-valiolone synthase